MKLFKARSLIGVVFFVNIQCAVAFLLWPGRYAPLFELQGSAGEAMIQGMGVLFLMWNVPYGVALWNPIRHRLALFEAVLMQAIGLAGETWIFLSRSSSLVIARAAIARFMIFDALGLLALIAAVWLTRDKGAVDRGQSRKDIYGKPC